MMKKEQLIKTLSKELDEGNLAIFAGAGLSSSAGFVNWKQLLKDIAEELDLDIDKEYDLVTLAQYHCNKNSGNRAKLNQLILEQFTTDSKPTENHEILARLPIYTYWTTNYDSLIENSLKKTGKVADVKYTNEQLATTKPKRDAIVYKMHGDANHPDKAILIRDDYESYYLKQEPYITALKGDLVSKTFLFLGFSFTDPNIEYILSRVRNQYVKNQRPHYCLLRKVAQEENEDQAEFEYRQKKQEFFCQDLQRFGITTFYVKEYSEITDILSELELKYKKKTIFISGAANEYGKWTKEEAEKFVYELSKELNKQSYKIISGFGLGIGSAVITGVLEQTLMNGKKLDNDQLILRPFPQDHIDGEKAKASLWTKYRKDMLSYAGVAIFLFGNKLQGKENVLSNGMIEEFEIAKKLGLFIIPVGITGYVAENIWKETISSFNDDNYKNGEQLTTFLGQLGETDFTLDQAKEVIFSILKLL